MDPSDAARTPSASTPSASTRSSAPEGDGVTMTRSAEALEVSVSRRPYKRVRVGKTVVTETVTVQVQVRREELVVEELPVDDPDGSLEVVGDPSGPTDREDVLEIVLHEERPVIAVRTVPVERVRAVRYTVTQDQRISAEVRQERIDVDEAASPVSSWT